MSDEGHHGTGADRGLLIVRLVIGLLQGLALFALHKLWMSKSWSLEPAAYWGLSLAAASAPLVLLNGWRTLRRGTLIAWTLAAAAIAGGLGAYDLLRQQVLPILIKPSLQPLAALATAAVLFIGHHLIATADEERRLIGDYRTYFDKAWQSAVQLALSAGFVAAAWALLFLGASLFQVIGIDALRKLIEKDWFAFPFIGVAFAAAVHLTDVRAGLTRGVRTIGLMLLSWLMPLMALIAAAFLAALPFTGLEPLWSTRHATGVLLGSAAALVLLVNAAYHDGAEERRPSAFLRWTGRLTAVIIAPVMAIAAYGLWLRVAQYGWTPERIMAGVGVLIGAIYAAGYLAAAVLPGPWLRLLERTNVLTSVVVLLLILALFTPLADPARISTDDQVARLLSGRTPPAKFDFDFLRFKAGRYGFKALERLKASKNDQIARAADAALKRTNRFVRRPDPEAKPLAARLTVYPAGKALPAGFLAQDWTGSDHWDGPCVESDVACDAYFADLDGDGVEEVLLSHPGAMWVYRAYGSGAWSTIGTLQPVDDQVRARMRAGAFKATPSPWKDLEVDGARLRVNPEAQNRRTNTEVRVFVR